MRLRLGLGLGGGLGVKVGARGVARGVSGAPATGRARLGVRVACVRPLKIGAT